MAESFQQYIKIRTFLGYRPKEILIELQNAFGDEAPSYANVQRWSKRFRDAIDSPIGSPLGSQTNFQTQEGHSNQQLDNNNLNEDNNMQKQLNTNANRSESIYNISDFDKSKQPRASRSKHEKP